MVTAGEVIVEVCCVPNEVREAACVELDVEEVVAKINKSFRNSTTMGCAHMVTGPLTVVVVRSLILARATILVDRPGSG